MSWCSVIHGFIDSLLFIESGLVRLSAFLVVVVAAITSNAYAVLKRCLLGDSEKKI